MELYNTAKAKCKDGLELNNNNTAVACKQLGGEQTKKIKSGRRWIMSRAS